MDTGDPIDDLPGGIRVQWVHALGTDLLLLDEECLALVDADLTRSEAAELIWSSTYERGDA